MDSIGTTLTASFFDSLNPSAFAQQMLLQAMVRRKRYIWFFIAGIGLANFAMGLAIYTGLPPGLPGCWRRQWKNIRCIRMGRSSSWVFYACGLACGC